MIGSFYLYAIIFLKKFLGVKVNKIKPSSTDRKINFIFFILSLTFVKIFVKIWPQARILTKKFFFTTDKLTQNWKTSRKIPKSQN